MDGIRLDVLMKNRSPRLPEGSTFIETPLALWIVIVCLIIPMIVLATAGIRYAFFLNAAQQAVRAAAQAKTFQQDFPPDFSATTLAQRTAQTACQAFSGVTLNSVTTSIVITPVSAGSPSTQTSKLSQPASEQTNLYQIQVQLVGQINPLVPLPVAAFGIHIPALTDPYPIQTYAKAVAENTQGLDQ